jgi:uncharacterized coiled-coil protein SlyX
MRRRAQRVVVAALVLASLSSCGGRDVEVEQRLARLEERMSALETTAARVPPTPVPHGATADLLALERRLATLEERMAAARGAVPEASDAVAARLDQRRERRARLREVTEQYRARLAAIRQEQIDPAARQQAVREALGWYREQRRAVLAGEEPPSP